MPDSVTRYYDSEPEKVDGWVCFPLSGNWNCINAEAFYSLRGPYPEWGWPNDGCTMSFDGIGGIRWWAACVIHDWHYSSEFDGGPSRIGADIIFAQNIFKLSRMTGGGIIESIAIAALYFRGVRQLGKGFYKK